MPIIDEGGEAVDQGPPPDFPGEVLGTIYSQWVFHNGAEDTVETTWRLPERPGVFTSRVLRAPGWKFDMDYVMRYEAEQIAELYAIP